MFNSIREILHNVTTQSRDIINLARREIDVSPKKEFATSSNISVPSSKRFPQSRILHGFDAKREFEATHSFISTTVFTLSLPRFSPPVTFQRFIIYFTSLCHTFLRIYNIPDYWAPLIGSRNFILSREKFVSVRYHFYEGRNVIFRMKCISVLYTHI